ncbi:hypothetical protein OG321_42150 [Streptomyces sp. NBC_00424]|uniref:hypothetical protein n=1 Tax=Streptomyces sp. NBC_00424 TaxID=2903648 RepID=UPI00224F4741|nr:hypothetical protein [Streptomyces sp. NBC_00424]MCX5079002.1 hypothetical protein [Streptomyces sp. NBC_00424]
MSFHTITYQGVDYLGPSEYDKADQEEALLLFQQMAQAHTANPDDTVGQVAYLMKCIDFPLQPTARWAKEEMRVHLKDRVKRFAAAYRAKAKYDAGLGGPQQGIKPPETIPVNFPGQRKEMVDPDTGELKTVFVADEPTNSPTPDALAVALNAAGADLYERDTRLRHEEESLGRASMSEELAAVERRHAENRERASEIKKERKQLAGYSALVEKLKSVRADHPEVMEAVDIIRAQGWDLKVYNLTLRKVREFMGRYQAAPVG